MWKSVVIYRVVTFFNYLVRSGTHRFFSFQQNVVVRNKERGAQPKDEVSKKGTCQEKGRSTP